MTHAILPPIRPSTLAQLRPPFWPIWLGGSHRFRRIQVASSGRPAAPGSGQHAREEGATAAPSRLVRTYAASLIELALQIEALEDGSPPSCRHLVRLGDLVADVVDALGPTAAEAGLRLFRDTLPCTDLACSGEPRRLRLVLHHLLLRTLVDEPAPGHVRVTLTCTRKEARITLLSRAPEPARMRRPAGGLSDLAAADRLLGTMKGVLVLEPRRGGYLPLTLALPVLADAPAAQAA